MVVQVCSALYRNGFGQVGVMLTQLQQWMEEQGYKKVEEFRGKMSQSRTHNPAAFERVQFMRYFKDRERSF
jgi:dihydroorotate dehydrogenase (fumarate)